MRKRYINNPKPRMRLEARTWSYHSRYNGGCSSTNGSIQIRMSSARALVDPILPLSSLCQTLPNRDRHHLASVLPQPRRVAASSWKRERRRRECDAVALRRSRGTRHDGLSKLETGVEMEGDGVFSFSPSFLRSMKKFCGNTAA